MIAHVKRERIGLSWHLKLKRRICEMKELVNPLLGTKYTRVFHEDEDQMQYNAPHRFFVSVSSVTEKDVTTLSLTLTLLPKFTFKRAPFKNAALME